MKKRLLLLLGLLVTAGSTAWAEIAHGTCKNGTWKIDDSGKLTINMTGKMADYGKYKTPWNEYREQIKAIHIGPGATNIGRHAFYALRQVVSVTGGENVEACAMGSFAYLGGGVEWVWKGVIGYRPENIDPIPSIYFPKCSYVGQMAFYRTCCAAISLPLVKTYKPDALFLSQNRHNWWEEAKTYAPVTFADLGQEVETIRPGSLYGVDYLFIQNPNPPDWERLYTREEQSTYYIENDFGYDSWERYYFYPFSLGSKVIVPPNLLETYCDYYPERHPEIYLYGYMGAQYWVEMEREHLYKSYEWPTQPAGKLLAGGPIYQDGKLIGGWYKENLNLIIKLLSDTMLNYGDDAPWKEVLGQVRSMYIGNYGFNKFTIPDECFTSGTKASASIRGIKSIFFEGSLDTLIIGNGAFRYCNELTEIAGNSRNREIMVGNEAFSECTNLTSLRQMTLCKVGTRAFYGCTNLNPNSEEDLFSLRVNDIPESAFENCISLRELDLSAVSVIGANAFKNSGFEDVCLNKIQSVGNNAFAGSGIQTIIFGPSTIHGKFANCCFADCNQLSDIFVSNYIGSASFNDIFNNVTLSNITLHAKPDLYSTYYENHAVFGQMKVDKMFAFPQGDPAEGWYIVDGTEDKEQHQATLRIYNDFAFDNVTEQPWYNFREYIREISIESGVTEIGSYVFAGLENVVSVILPFSVKNIGNFAFDGCTKLQNISIIGVENIGSCAFQDCPRLERVDLGMGLKKAGNYIFRRCKSLNYIGNKDSTPAEVTNFTFAEIGSDAYQARHPGGRAKAASNGGQSNVTLQVPDEFVTNYIVDKNWGKFHIKLADGRGTWVDAGRFGDGTWILYEDSVMIIAADKGPGKSWEESNPVKLGFGRSSDPLSAVNCTNRIEFTGNISRLDGGFNNFPNLRSVSLCPSIKTIDGTFAYCGKLTQINLENVDTIGDFTFECTNLDIVKLPNTRYIGRNAFYKCHNLRYASLDQPCELKQGAFLWCPELTAINLAEAQLDGAAKCFGSCYKLKSAVFTGKYLPEDIFANTFSLTHIDLGEHLDSIDANAFRGCNNLDTIYCGNRTPPAMPWGKRVVGDVEYPAQAFYGRNLKNIHLFVPADLAVLYRKADVWKDMTIEVDTTYVESLLPTGGAIADKGTWHIDSDGTLTLDFEGSAWTVNVGGSNFRWHDLLASWMPFITRVVVSDRVKTVPAYMAGEHDPANSAGVVSVEIGSHVTEVNNGSLNYSGLKDVYCYAESSPICWNTAFDWEAIAANNATLHVVTSPGVLERYQKSKSWSQFPNIVADLTSRMPAGIFHSPSAEGLEIWYRVTDENAKTCETFVNDVAGRAVEMNSYAHYDQLTIPATVQYNGETYTVTGIGDDSFYGCMNFDTFILPESLENIGVNAFNSCWNVHEFTLPASVKYIGEYAFEMWTNIERFTVSGTTPPTVDDNFINTYWDPDMRPKPTLLVPDGYRDTWNVAPWNKWFNVIDPFNKGVLTYRVKPGAEFYDYYQNDEEYMCIEGLKALNVITYENEMVGRVWDDMIEDWSEIWGDVYYNQNGKKLFYLDDESRIQIFEGVTSADNIYYEFKEEDFETMMYTTGRNVDLYKGAAIVFPESGVQTDIYFTATNADGIDISYRVLDLEKKTCEVKADPNGYTYNAFQAT
ncbi:MAG: leucine-rich repeat domain-containing protein [Bacteroidaceae bacterium]|nr:leucine-rich repeat domain-containing protein [Bacteroidaceae bacterium]